MPAARRGSVATTWCCWPTRTVRAGTRPRSPPGGRCSTGPSPCTDAAPTSCRRRSRPCMPTSRATGRRSTPSTGSSPASPVRRSWSSAGPSRSPSRRGPRWASASSTASISTATATCTRRGASCCGAWAGPKRPARPTAGRWRWSTTTPSGACSSGGWQSSAGRLEVPPPPVEDRLEACDAVAGQAGAGQLVALAGEQQELDLDLALLEGDEQALGLLDRAAPVVLGVDQQHRDADPVDVGERALGQYLPWVGAVVGLDEEPADVARALEAVEGVAGPLADRGPEVAAVGGQPAGHVTAVGA